MKVFPRPWRRLFPAGASRVSLTLVLGGWGILGAGLWAAEAIDAYLLHQRPRIFLEVFIADSATASQIEEISQQIQAQTFCCGTAFVAAEDARLRAARDPRVRRLLEAYGGNPLPRIVRVELCPASVPDCAEAISWLRSLPQVSGARAPEAFVGGLLAGERLISRLADAGAAAACLLGGILGVLGLGLVLGECLPEIAAMERDGAAPAMIFSRLAWTLLAPGLTFAVLVFILLRLAIMLAALSAPWLEEAGGAYSWISRLPALSGKSAALLMATPMISGGLMVLLSFFARILKKPS